MNSVISSAGEILLILILVCMHVMFGEVDATAAPILDLEIMTREGKIALDDFFIRRAGQGHDRGLDRRF